MKYCTKCGNQLNDEAIMCPSCGCPTELYQQNMASSDSDSNRSSGLKTVTKVFMIIGCVLSGFIYLLPLAWTIPMTVIYCKKIKNGEKISVAFKVCTLIFVSLIAGILMLCDNEQ